MQWFQHLVLPWVTLALLQSAIYTRLTRGSLLDVLGEDYIRTARAKGLPERRVIYRHGLRSALTPVITQFGVDIGVLIGGTLVTESVFGLQGIGQMTVQSLTNGDLPVIMGVVLIAAFFVVLGEHRRRHRLRLPRPARPSVLTRHGHRRPVVPSGVAGRSLRPAVFVLI